MPNTRGSSEPNTTRTRAAGEPVVVCMADIKPGGSPNVEADRRPDPDLKAIVAAWPALSPDIRRAVAGMVRAASE
jgi:hypothetical protein